MALLSLAAARSHLEKFALPRRIRDEAAELAHFASTGKQKIIYRRVLKDEKQRGELYPAWGLSFEVMSQFGIGIGLYFHQIVLVVLISFIAGLMMSPAIAKYSKGSSQSYILQGIYNQSIIDVASSVSTAPLLLVTAVCTTARNVTVTNCHSTDPSACQATYKPDCDISSMVIIMDMVMSLFVVVAVICCRFIQEYFEAELDEAIQSAQDYSLLVADPDPDAGDPDEWHRFFSRYGTVRYITITRKNASLAALLIKRNKISRRIREANDDKTLDCLHAAYSFIFKTKIEKLKLRLEAVDKELSQAFLKTYPVSHVYVTFEFEEYKLLASNALAVSDLNALFDRRKNVKSRDLFRESNVLDIREPAEPDNIKWKNGELSKATKLTWVFFSRCLTIGILITCFFIIEAAAAESSVVLSITIVIVDSAARVLFSIIATMESHSDEATFQLSLQQKLFGVRLLLSTIFPYLRQGWKSFLDEVAIQQFVSVQLSACFADTLLSLLNLPGFMTKYVVAPILSMTQGELNNYWSGVGWNLSERYTIVTKIVFIAFFYTLIMPLSPFVCSVSLILLCLCDRYLLVRSWEQPAMLNGDVATVLRGELVAAIAAHMYISCRLIYSWPMDEVYLNSETLEFNKADKFPAFWIGSLRTQDWHTESQRKYLIPYLIATGCVCIVTVYIWIVDPAVKSFRKFFFKHFRVLASTVHYPFSALSRAFAYVPVVEDFSEKFLLADTSLMLEKHLPSLVRGPDGEIPDLRVHVPQKYRKHVLAVVKWYGDVEDPMVGEDESKVREGVPKDVVITPSTAIAPKMKVDESQLSAKDRRVLEAIGDEEFLARKKVKSIPRFKFFKKSSSNAVTPQTEFASFGDDKDVELSQSLNDAPLPAIGNGMMSTLEIFRKKRANGNKYLATPDSVPEDDNPSDEQFSNEEKNLLRKVRCISISDNR